MTKNSELGSDYQLIDKISKNRNSLLSNIILNKKNSIRSLSRYSNFSFLSQQNQKLFEALTLGQLNQQILFKQQEINKQLEKSPGKHQNQPRLSKNLNIHNPFSSKRKLNLVSNKTQKNLSRRIKNQKSSNLIEQLTKNKKNPQSLNTMNNKKLDEDGINQQQLFQQNNNVGMIGKMAFYPNSNKNTKNKRSFLINQDQMEQFKIFKQNYNDFLNYQKLINSKQDDSKPKNAQHNLKITSKSVIDSVKDQKRVRTSQIRRNSHIHQIKFQQNHNQFQTNKIKAAQVKFSQSKVNKQIRRKNSAFIQSTNSQQNININKNSVLNLRRLNKKKLQDLYQQKKDPDPKQLANNRQSAHKYDYMFKSILNNRILQQQSVCQQQIESYIKEIQFLSQIFNDTKQVKLETSKVDKRKDRPKLIEKQENKSKQKTIYSCFAKLHKVKCKQKLCNHLQTFLCFCQRHISKYNDKGNKKSLKLHVQNFSHF